ncbi:tetratricopeptide repeat protein [Desulfosoma caldarium]|uniref:Tetratricopeptide repeat protein n=1 Tax=Desulfosoma caldarium TaxID=610254 RepID=A0A3N1UJF4_9BACT|nr:tetratricopeptide repeat protein [Desulfosoma caldarium]ROQ89898.1 tetratricopeptide repeat protein [Desulfosoma caldarium]
MVFILWRGKDGVGSCPGARCRTWVRRVFVPALILALGLSGTLEASAQESNQAALIHVEKSNQAHLLMPKPLAVPTAANATSAESSRSAARVEQTPSETGLFGSPLDVARLKLTIAWGHYNQGRYQEAAALFKALAREEKVPSVVEESRLGLAYCMIRLDRPSEAAHLLEDMVTQGVRLQETVPALVETLLALKRYEEAEKYLPLLP